MGVLSRALFRAEGGYGPLDDFWYRPVSGGATLSGIKVGVEAALSSSPVWGSVRLLADSVASLPLVVFKRRFDGGKERDPNHPVYDVLHDAPNPLMTAANFRRVLMVHALLYGNAYAEIRGGPRGFADTLWPLHPDGVRIEKIPGGKVRYYVRQDDGREEPYDDDVIFHMPGLSLNGITGLSLIQYARESIGVNIAARQYTSKFFVNGRPSGILTHPGKLTKDGRTNMRQEWEEIHRDSHKVAILQEGVSWAATGLSAEDAQLIGVLEWSAADVARYFNVPLHLLQETSKVTSWGSGIEELNFAFVTYSLLPWLVNWQQTITKDLITSKIHFAEFIVDALLRGKTLERYQAYQIATGNAPWMTQNEARARENMNALPGGDDIQKPAAPSSPRPPAAPPSNQPKDPGALAQVLARDTAARVVRREQTVLERGRQIDQAEHAAFVAQQLHLQVEDLRIYIDMLTEGAMDAEHRIEYLTAMALEAQE